MRAVNLLPREETTRRKTSEGGRNVIAIIAAAGGLVVVIVLAVAVAMASSKVKNARADLAQAQTELAQTPAHASGALARNRLLSARERRTLALASTLSRRVAWDRILRRLALVLPDDVWLTNLTGTTPTSAGEATATASTPATTPTALTLEGYSYSHTAVARLLSRLGVVPDLKDVQLQTSTAEELNGVRVVRFTIAADVRRAGDPK